MLQTEEQNKKIKENIKAAWAEGDLWGLACAGIDSFLNMLGNSTPISFQRFLEYTGVSFDKYILETAQKEHLKYVGGKMILELDRDTSTVPVSIRLSADFYLQTTDKKWVVKKKNGMVESTRFSDWDTAPDAIKLRTTGKLELSIEPPEPGAE